MRVFLVLLGVSTLAYSVVALPFGAARWLVFGPFAVQASRIFLYTFYFFFGVIVGAPAGLDKGLVSFDGALTRRWPLWTTGALVAFFALVIIHVIGQKPPSGLPTTFWRIALDVSLVVCCAALSFALVAIFLRFENGRMSMLDCIRDEAYGIYLVHYFFVVWLQIALLDLDLAAIFKAAVVFPTALALSWCLIYSIRKLPRASQII